MMDVIMRKNLTQNENLFENLTHLKLLQISRLSVKCVRFWHFFSVELRARARETLVIGDLIILAEQMDMQNR